MFWEVVFVKSRFKYTMIKQQNRKSKRLYGRNLAVPGIRKNDDLFCFRLYDIIVIGISVFTSNISDYVVFFKSCLDYCKKIRNNVGKFKKYCIL